MIQDCSFAADGTLLYPPPKIGTHPMWMQEFFGENICVNGKATPFLEVEPRKYRFRLVNGSNSRFYHLMLVPSDETGKATGKPTGAPPSAKSAPMAACCPRLWPCTTSLFLPASASI